MIYNQRNKKKDMSGISGHMMHPHEDVNLKFFEYERLVMEALGERTVRPATIKEKIDGFGFQFTVTEDFEVRLVRSKTDLESGGVKLKDIPQRMSHNLEAAKLYDDAIRKVQILIDENEELRENIKVWPCTFNCEIIKDGMTNVVEYHRGPKVYIHNCWMHNYTSDKPIVTTGIRFFDILKGIKGDVEYTPVLKLNRYPNYFIDMMMNELKGLFKCPTLKANTTLLEEYAHRIEMKIYNRYIDAPHATECAWDVVRYIFKSNPKNLRELKKKWGEDIFNKEFLEKTQREIVARFDAFDLTIGELAISGITPNDEMKPQNKVVEYVNEAFEKELLDTHFYERQMLRWEITGYRIHSIEGITIDDKYKFTGSFGPLNQLIGKIKRNAEK